MNIKNNIYLFFTVLYAKMGIDINLDITDMDSSQSNIAAKKINSDHIINW